MNNQEIFDTVSTHLFTQGVQSTTLDDNDRKMCAYRGDNGTRCAIGVLIPDDVYSEHMEGHSVESFIMLPFLNPNNTPELFLTRLQMAHDNDGNWECESNMKKTLTRIAEDYHLDFSILHSLSLGRT